MFKELKALFLLLIMTVSVASAAVHHAFEHDDDAATCEFCITVNHSQYSDLHSLDPVKFSRVFHYIFVVESCDAYDAFAKAETQIFSLSIRPPPFCA